MHGQVCWLLRGRACHRRRCDSSPASRVCHQRACLPASSLSCLPGDPARGWSDEFSFRTAPLVGPEALPYRLGLVGDLGQTDHSLRCADDDNQLGMQADCLLHTVSQFHLLISLPLVAFPLVFSTLEHMTTTNADSVILTGDLSYADGYQPRWCVCLVCCRLAVQHMRMPLPRYAPHPTRAERGHLLLAGVRAACSRAAC